MKLAWFYQKINGFQRNCCILWIDKAWGLQQLGIIFENEVPSNSKLAKHDFCKSCSSIQYLKKWIKRCFLYNKDIFEIENRLWKLKIHQFEVAGVMSIHKIQ